MQAGPKPQRYLSWQACTKLCRPSSSSTQATMLSPGTSCSWSLTDPPSLTAAAGFGSDTLVVSCYLLLPSVLTHLLSGPIHTRTSR